MICTLYIRKRFDSVKIFLCLTGKMGQNRGLLYGGVMVLLLTDQNMEDFTMFKVKQFISKVGPTFFPTFERDIYTEDGTVTVQAGGSGALEDACCDCELRGECDDRMPDDTAALVRISAPEGNVLIENGEDGVILYSIGSQSTVALRKALEFAVQALKDAEDGESDTYDYHDAGDRDVDTDNDTDETAVDDTDETAVDDSDIIGEPLEGESPEDWLLRTIFCGTCTKCYDKDIHHTEDPTHGYAD